MPKKQGFRVGMRWGGGGLSQKINTVYFQGNCTERIQHAYSR